MKRLWKGPAFFGKYGDRYVERVGRKDGRLDPPIPRWDADRLPPFAWEIVEAGDGDIQRLKQGWSREDRSLLPAWQGRSHAARQAAVRAGDAETALADAEKAFEDAHGGKAAPTDWRFSLYWFAMAALALAEIPFNAIVFRSVGESELMTFVFTASLAASVVGCAHLLGVYLHKLRDRTGRLLRKHVALAVLLTAVPLGVIGSIAWFRADYLSRPRPVTETAAETLAGASAHAAPALPPGAVHLIDVPMLVSFLFFNLILFLLAAAYSFNVHDELLAAVYRRRRERRGALKAHAGTQRALARARGRREKRHGHYNAVAHQTGKSVNRLMQAYKTVNLQARNDRHKHTTPYPLCYDRYGGIDLPEELDGLEWPEETAHTQSAPLSASPAEGPTLSADAGHAHNSIQEKENTHVRNGYSVTKA